MYALSGDKLSGDLRPERVQKWMVFEKDGGVDGAVVRGGYVVSREWVEGYVALVVMSLPLVVLDGGMGGFGGSWAGGRRIYRGKRENRR